MEDNSTVRPLTAEELPLLEALFRYDDPRAELARDARDMRRGELVIFGLWRAGELVGELHARLSCDDADMAVPGVRAYLFAFRVREDMRGMGLGRQLMRRTLLALADMGYREATIGVEDDEPRVRRMYERAGFTQKIARKSERYGGRSYGYDLLLRG